MSLNTYTSFHIAYDNGQRSVWGAIPGLADHLETYGSGLPTDPLWWRGGPLVVDTNHKERQVCAWIRSMRSDVSSRPGAWEAWGVIGPAGGFGNWMTFWDSLAGEPERGRLDQMALALGDGLRGAGYPPIPQRLVSVLAELYANDATTQRIALYLPSEVALLPWCCALGPFPPEAATIGPPRRMELKVKVPVTYDASIIDVSPVEARPVKAVESPLLNELVARVQRGAYTDARDIVAGLRNSSLVERQRQIYALAVFTPPLAKTKKEDKPEPVASGTQTVTLRTSWPPRQASSLPEPPARPALSRVFRRWGTVLVAGLTAAILILQMATLWLMRHPAATPIVDHKDTSTTTSASTATNTTGSIAAADTTGASSVTNTTGLPNSSAAPIDCATRLTTPESRKQLFYLLQQKIIKEQFRLKGPAAGVVVKGAWDASSTKTIEGLAVQLQIVSTKCGRVGLDGDAGKTTLSAIDACTKHGYTVAQGPAALQWLCDWVAPPQP